MNIKGIVFDKDGTLINLPAFWIGPVKYTIKELQNVYGFNNGTAEKMMIISGLRPDGTEIQEGLIVCGTNQDIAVAWQLFLRKQGIRTKEDFIEKAGNMLSENSAYGNVQGITDLYPLLLKLKKRGMKIGIATSDDYEQTKYCMEKLGVLSFFDTIVGADMVEHPKPAADIMKVITSEWKILPNEILMVGDSVNDMRFAEISGALGVYFNEHDGELPQGARFRISDLYMILGLIE